MTIHFQDRSGAASLRHINRAEISVLLAGFNPAQEISGSVCITIAATGSAIFLSC